MVSEGGISEGAVDAAAALPQPGYFHSSTSPSPTSTSSHATSSTTPFMGPPDTPVAPALSSFADHGQEDEASGEIIEMVDEENAKEFDRFAIIVFILLFEIKRGQRG